LADMSTYTRLTGLPDRNTDQPSSNEDQGRYDTGNGDYVCQWAVLYEERIPFSSDKEVKWVLPWAIEFGHASYEITPKAHRVLRVDGVKWDEWLDNVDNEKKGVKEMIARPDISPEKTQNPIALKKSTALNNFMSGPKVIKLIDWFKDLNNLMDADVDEKTFIKGVVRFYDDNSNLSHKQWKHMKKTMQRLKRRKKTRVLKHSHIEYDILMKQGREDAAKKALEVI